MARAYRSWINGFGIEPAGTHLPDKGVDIPFWDEICMAIGFV